jgi:hypothetical protein
MIAAHRGRGSTRLSACSPSPPASGQRTVAYCGLQIAHVACSRLTSFLLSFVCRDSRRTRRQIQGDGPLFHASMPRRKQTSVSASAGIGGNASMRPSLAPTASNSNLTPTGSRKRVRSSSPSPPSRCAAPTNATKSSKLKADVDSPRASHVAEKEPTHPPLIRSISSDSYFVSALTRDPSISLFVAHSPRSDFSLLCDDSVLAALNDGHGRDEALVRNIGSIDQPSARKQPLAPLSRLKVRALAPACRHP